MRIDQGKGIHIDVLEICNCSEHSRGAKPGWRDEEVYCIYHLSKVLLITGAHD